MPSEKFGEIVVAALEQNREIAPINNMARGLQGLHTFYEVTKIGNHLRRAASQIDNRDIGLAQPVNDSVDGFSRHDLLAFRPGVHMAMHTSEVAKLADVNLQDLGLGAAQLKAFGSQSVRKPR